MPTPADTHLRIAAIVPALDEAGWIAPTLERLLAEADDVIVADGGSADDTREIAQALGARVVESACGRGTQMNAGARAAGARASCAPATGAQAATGADALVFVHADTLLPRGWADDVRATLADPAVALGAFAFATDSPRRTMRAVERLVALRCAVAHTPYGDQALFLRRETIERLGGFAEQPLLEDYDLVRRAARLGRIRTLAHRPAITSARMWERLGIARTWWRNLRTVVAYRLGADPATLAARRRR